MSFLGNLAGGLLGQALGGAVSSAQSAALYEKQAEIQYKNWEKMQSNKHQLEVKDLEAAGLNKILSATNGSALSAPSISAPSVDSKLGTTAMQLSIEQQKAEIEKTRAEADSLRADTDRERLGIERQDADTRLFLADTDYRRYLLDKDLNEANIGYIAAETGKSLAQTQATYESIERDWAEANSRIGLNNSQTEASLQQASMYKAQTEKALKELGLTEKEIENLGLTNEEIQRRLNDPDVQLRKIYRSSPLGLITGIFRYAREDILPGGSGASLPVNRSGMRVGVHN